MLHEDRPSYSANLENFRLKFNGFFKIVLFLDAAS